MTVGSLTMIKGPEAALADRALDHLRAAVLAEDPSTEVNRISAAGYVAGQVDLLTAPSLFEESRLVIVDDVDRAGEACVKDILSYVASPMEGVRMVLRHRGGNKNRKVIDVVTKSGAQVIDCQPLKNDRDKLKLVAQEAERIGGTLSTRAATAIVDAVGSDLYEVLRCTRQLVSDHGPVVPDDAVAVFFAGRSEATGFEVADAIVKGQGPRALLLYRQARAIGEDDIPLLGAIAAKFRDMALVGGNHPPAGWRGKIARENARLWTDAQIGAVLVLLAHTDGVLKGAPGSADHAIEKCIIEISRLRAR